MENKDWKTEIFKYLTLYNSTPYSTTGKSPSELFFRRQFRDKILSVIDLEQSEIDQEVREKDIEMKMRGREIEDKKRRATESSVDIREKVYIKNMVKKQTNTDLR